MIVCFAKVEARNVIFCTNDRPCIFTCIHVWVCVCGFISVYICMCLLLWLVVVGCGWLWLVMADCGKFFTPQLLNHAQLILNGRSPTRVLFIANNYPALLCCCVRGNSWKFPTRSAGITHASTLAPKFHASVSF